MCPHMFWSRSFSCCGRRRSNRNQATAPGTNERVAAHLSATHHPSVTWRCRPDGWFVKCALGGVVSLPQNLPEAEGGRRQGETLAHLLWSGQVPPKGPCVIGLVSRVLLPGRKGMEP